MQTDGPAQVLGWSDYFQPESDTAKKRGLGAPKPPGGFNGAANRTCEPVTLSRGAKESFDIAKKDRLPEWCAKWSPRAGNKDCTTVAAASRASVGYVVNASRIADRRLILAGYRLADLLTRLTQN